MKKIIAAIVILIAAFIIYIIVTIKKLEYDFEIIEYKPVKISASEGGVINVLLKIIIKNPLFFSLPVQGLYYEIFYKDTLLGKSADTSGFTINGKLKMENGKPVIDKSIPSTTVNQSINLYVNKTTLEVAKNYLFKKPTEFTAKVYAKIFGINIKLTNLKFTY